MVVKQWSVKQIAGRVCTNERTTNNIFVIKT